MVKEEGIITQGGLYIGVDGCRGGWIATVLDQGELRLKKYESIESLVQEYPSFDAFLIDMAVGLQDRAEQVRPDHAARKELQARASSVFPIPCREAVYAEGEAAQKEANLRIPAHPRGAYIRWEIGLPLIKARYSPLSALRA